MSSPLHERLVCATVAPIVVELPPANEPQSLAAAGAPAPLRMTIQPPRITTTTPGVIRRTAR